MKKKQGNKQRQKFNCLTNAQKPVEAMTANDVAFMSDRIFRDLAKGNFDPTTDAPKFENNPIFLNQLIVSAQIKLFEANLIANSMNFCFNDAVKKGSVIDQNSAAVKNRWENKAQAYNVLVIELMNIQNTGSAVTPLAKISQQLWKVKQYFD